MTKTNNHKPHFNLYYIFLEDKQNYTLNDEKAGEMLKSIIRRTNRNLNGQPPPDG